MEKVFNIWKNFEESVVKSYPHFKIPFYLLKTIFKYILTFLISPIILLIILLLERYIAIYFIPELYLVFLFYYSIVLAPSIIFIVIFSKNKTTFHPIIISMIPFLLLSFSGLYIDELFLYAPISLLLNLVLLLFHQSILDLIKIIKFPAESITGIIKNRNHLLILNIIIIVIVVLSSIFLKCFYINDELKTFKNLINEGSYDYRDYYYLAMFQYNNSDYWGARNSLLEAISRNPLCFDSWFFFFGNDFLHASHYKQNYNSSFIIE